MASRKKTSGRKKQASTRPQDAIAMLKADHEKVQSLFDEFDTARRGSQKQRLVEEICMELTVHATLEEEIFYPAARAAIDDSDLLDEAEIEHASAKELIAQLEELSPGDDKYDARVTVLGEYIRHHVKEEQGELFPLVRKADLDLVDLADQMRTRREELMQA